MKRKKDFSIRDTIRSIKINSTLVISLAVILVIAAFVYIPIVKQELSPKPSEAGGLLDPGFPGDSTPWTKPEPPDSNITPWGKGPSDDLPNPDFQLSLSPETATVFAGLDTRYEIKIDTNMGFGVANDGEINLFSPELDSAISNNQITDYRFKSKYPWPSDPIFCGPDSHFIVYLYIDTFIDADMEATSSNIVFKIIGISDQTASYEQTGGDGEYIVTSETEPAILTIRNTGWIPEGESELIVEYGYQGKIHNNKIVYVSSWIFDHNNIYVKDLNTGAILPVCTDPAYQLFPVIYDNYVAWQDYRNGKSDIYFYDLSNPMAGEKNITNDPLIDDWQPAIHGKYIVYIHGSYAGSDGTLNVYNIEDQTTTTINPSTITRPSMPDIYENLIIWANLTDIPNARLHSYNLDTGEEKVLINHSEGDQACSRIHEKRIVWQERIGDLPGYIKNKIHLYDIETGEDTIIADYNNTGGRSNRWPVVFKDLIIWLGDETNETTGGEADMFFHKISDPIGDNYKITDDDEPQSNPDIFENKIIYTDSSTGHHHTFLFEWTN